MRAKLYSVVLVTLMACGTNSATQPKDDTTVSDTGPTLVIEPLVPQQELPPGSDPHYDFAHVVLPLLVFSSAPHDVREQFLGPTANEFLRRQWDVLHTSPPSAVPRAESVSLDVGPAALVAMPPPTRNAHAYFTLIVFKDSGPIRYMTLERGVFMRDDVAERTVLGEWSIEDGRPTHGNFGEGPPPTRDAFLEAVVDYLR